MKIALLQPAIPDGNYIPSLGLLYIAAVLEEDGFSVRVFDENYRTGFLPDLLKYAPDLVGITAVTASINRSLRLAEDIKRELNAWVVLGGPHPTALPDETIRNPHVDFVVAGEGEYPMRDLARAIQKGGGHDELREISNLLFKEDGSTVRNRQAGFLSGEDLDRLPYPAFHLLDLEFVFTNATHGMFSMGKRILPVMTARGCPNTCTFCCRVMGYHIRERSVDSVIKEITYLKKKYDIDELYFEDDNFTDHRQRALRILEALIGADLGIFIKFANGLRADRVDRELLLKIREAGGYWIGFGIESGSPRTLESMRKNLDLDLAGSNVRLAKSLGFYVGSNCIIGYPGETRDDLQESLRYFLGLKLDSCAIVTLIPFPRTAVRAFCVKKGYLNRNAENYDNYFFKIFNPNVLISTPFLSEGDIKRYVRFFYLRFYFQPVKIFRVIRVLFRRMVLSRARSLVIAGKGA